MQLITMLLMTVSVLTILSGIIVYFGSSKTGRARSAWYFLAAIFATIWMASICFFLTAHKDSDGLIEWHVNWTFISAILLDTAFLGYAAWSKKYGKVTTVVFLAIGLAISAIIFLTPELLYKSINLNNTGNTVTMNFGPMYYAYIGFFATIVPVIVGVYLYQFFKTSSQRKRFGDIITMCSFGLSSTIVLVFNLILPLFNNWSLIWFGPLALAVTILAVYYTILRYRILNLSSVWLRIFSYAVVIASVAIVYMIIFSIVFAALFKGSAPSTEVIILNFIMILIFISLMPIMTGLTEHIRSLISGNTISKSGKKE